MFQKKELQMTAEYSMYLYLEFEWHTSNYWGSVCDIFVFSLTNNSLWKSIIHKPTVMRNFLKILLLYNFDTDFIILKKKLWIINYFWKCVIFLHVPDYCK